MKQWYKELFDDYSKNYDKEDFAQGTVGECDFIEQELNYNKELKILDIGCGTGRHTIELTKRGYKVTGIDLSYSQLQRAREKATAENLQIDFIMMDARELSYYKDFDVAIMLCEGAFPLMETDEMNFQILQRATQALNDKGKFIFTTLNGLFPLFHSVKDFCNSLATEGNPQYKESSFDLMTFRDYNTMIVEDEKGNKKELECNERYYVPCEISWLLKTLGYRKIAIHPADLGAFSREKKLTPDDFEMLIIADKQPE